MIFCARATRGLGRPSPGRALVGIHQALPVLTHLALHTSMAEFTYRRCISFQTQRTEHPGFSH
jgi:hypothetical protein